MAWHPSMAGVVGFRNFLVHGYADVDDRRVLGKPDRLEDLRGYISALTRLLDTDDPPSRS